MNAKPDKMDARWTRTRQRLLAGGRKIFALQGVEATTILDVVRAAGVSQPSFYNHFATKDELAQEIAAEFFRRDRETKLAVFAELDDPAEAIAINVQQTLSIATEDPVVAWVLIKSQSLRNIVISSKTDPLAAMIEAGVKQGRFNVSSAHTAAIAIRGAALALVQDMLNGSADRHATKSLQEMVLRMLGIDSAESTRVVERSRRKTKQTIAKVA